MLQHSGRKVQEYLEIMDILFTLGRRQHHKTTCLPYWHPSHAVSSLVTVPGKPGKGNDFLCSPTSRCQSQDWGLQECNSPCPHPNTVPTSSQLSGSPVVITWDPHVPVPCPSWHDHSSLSQDSSNAFRRTGSGTPYCGRWACVQGSWLRSWRLCSPSLLATSSYVIQTTSEVTVWVRKTVCVGQVCSE